MGDWLTPDFFSIVVAGFFVGIVVGLTGMGGGALMTPALIFLGVGNASDGGHRRPHRGRRLQDAAGAMTHARQGSPNLTLAKWLIIGSVPSALVGPWLIHRLAGGRPGLLDRAAHGVHRVRAAVRGRDLRPAPLHQPASDRAADVAAPDPDPRIRPLVTVGVGALGGLLVGITSVGAGSVIMIALLMLYPGLSPVRLVGTDLVQAVPLVLAAATSNIVINGLDWHILVPLVLGSTPGTVLGAPARTEGAAVVHPPRHRGGADDVRRGAAGQVRLGSARLRRRTPPTRCWWASSGLAMIVLVPSGLGPHPAYPRSPHVRRAHRRRARGRGRRGHGVPRRPRCPTTSPRCRRAGTPHTPHTPDR